VEKDEDVSEASGERPGIRMVRKAAGPPAGAANDATVGRRAGATKDAVASRRAASMKDPAAIGPRAVDRAAAILLSFSFSQPSLSLAQLAQAARLPKPSAYRIVSSLVANGLVRQAEDGRYEPGFRLFELGAIVQSRLVLAQVAAAVVQTLAEETGETVLVTQVTWPAHEVVVVAKVDSRHPVGVLSPLGRRSHIAMGCLGKAALAGLPPERLASTLADLALTRYTERTITSRRALRREIEATRQRGYALDKEEYLPGVSGAASWLHLGDPCPVGAVGVVGPTQRLPAERLAQIGERVAALARALSFERPATAGA
jgi:DNA-binding IclR family transcriptional regulator